MTLPGRDRLLLEAFISPVGTMRPSIAKKTQPDFSGWVFFVASEGFEPPKAEPADLQSDPFGRLGN